MGKSGEPSARVGRAATLYISVTASFGAVKLDIVVNKSLTIHFLSNEFFVFCGILYNSILTDFSS